MTVSRFGVELRSEISGRKLTGHASVFNQVTKVPGNYEQIARSAFDRVLADPSTDVRALFNHDPNFLLGRQSSGTLRLSTDSEGLVFEVDLPNTTVGNDVRELAERGDLNGASFAFIPDDDEWSTHQGRRLRTHTSVRSLIDVSPVTFPAYTGASVSLRSFLDFQEPTRAQLIRVRARVRNEKGLL